VTALQGGVVRLTGDATGVEVGVGAAVERFPAIWLREQLPL
jgi:hypothetical protein